MPIRLGIVPSMGNSIPAGAHGSIPEHGALVSVDDAVTVYEELLSEEVILASSTHTGRMPFEEMALLDWQQRNRRKGPSAQVHTLPECGGGEGAAGEDARIDRLDEQQSTSLGNPNAAPGASRSVSPIITDSNASAIADAVDFLVNAAHFHRPPPANSSFPEPRPASSLGLLFNTTFYFSLHNPQPTKSLSFLDISYCSLFISIRRSLCGPPRLGRGKARAL